MKILSLSFDSSLLDEKESSMTSMLARQLAYAEALREVEADSEYHILIYTKKGEPYKARTFDHGLTATATQSPSRPAFLIDAIHQGRKIIEANKIDLITTQTPFIDGLAGWRLKKRFDIPLILQMRSNFIDNQEFIKEKKINRIFNGLGKYLLKRADGIRVISQNDKDFLEERLDLTGKINFIPPAVAAQQKASEPNQAMKAFAKDADCVFLYAGRFEKEKGVPDLLKAFALLKNETQENIKLALVGDGRQMPELKQMAKERGIEKEILFPGFVPYQELGGYYKGADVFAMCSHYEGYGKAFVEAGAYALPIITTETAGAKELLTANKNALFVETHSPESIVGAMKKLLENKELRGELGQNAEKMAAEASDFETVVKKQNQMFFDTREKYRKTANY